MQFLRILVLALLSAPLGAQAEPPRVRVLFLGDRAHHQPAERAQQVLAPFAARGIDLFFSERLDDLNDAELRRYDVLFVYANWTQLGRTRERAVLDFVAGGKGLVAVHSASACFADSAAWTALVGAQFARHGGGEFAPRWVAPDHPILRGLTPYRCWDETYEHRRHAADRTLLAVRGDGDAAEPWTWLRTHGMGRVFYTASGHDDRTWREHGFQELLLRGIRWASGDDEPDRAAPAPLPQVASDTPIPRYDEGRPWGESRNVDRMQPPLTPQESLRRLVLPPELAVTLFAAEPDIVKPIALAFDARGRLWIAETVDYPNELAAEGSGRDRIRICTDRDGDGRADQFTLFAEGLSIPTSLVCVGDGVLVASPPHILHLRDTDGDDRCDQRSVLISGFGTGDTHAGPSNLRYGFDNWIWGTVGYAGFRGVVGGRRHRFGQGIFRFRPDGSELEFVASTSNNTWGLGVDETGNVFASTANGNPSVALAIPNRYYETTQALAPDALPTIAETNRIHPITAAVRQADFHGRFTAAAGHTIYTARALPQKYWNRAAFVCEPTGHLVARLWLERDGAGFVARDGWNLIASDDEWTAPIAAEVGPDGAVWVLDWCNYIVQHNPTPQGFQTGKGNAYETPLRDKTRGRILRIAARDGMRAPRLDLQRAGTSELVAALRDDNLLWRLHAQRLLVERDARDAEAALGALLAAPVRDALGLDPGALHALWTMHALGSFSRGEDVPLVKARAALAHPVAAVRRAALAVLPPQAATAEAILAAGLLADREPAVRLAALLALAEVPPSPAPGAALFEFVRTGQDAGDRRLGDAATIAAARHDAAFLRSALRSGAPAARPARPNPDLIPNGSFEERDGEALAGWQVRHYGGRAEHDADAMGRSGRGIAIRSRDGADSSFFARVEVAPDTTYRLSGWIRTENVTTRNGRGAQLNVHEIQGPVNARTQALVGSCAWTEVSVQFESGAHTELTINCLLGGWGHASGEAWFDDIRLVRVDTPLPGRLGKVVARVTAHLGSRAPGGEVFELLAALPETEPVLAAAFVEGLAAGWPPGRPASLSPAERAELPRIAAVLDDAARAGLVALVERWGEPGLLREARQTILANQRALLRDPGQPGATRITAAQRCLELAPSPELVHEILLLLTADTEPELASGLLEAVAQCALAEIGPELIARLQSWPPALRRAALLVLVRRQSWCEALLAALRGAMLPVGALPAEIWLALEQHPHAEIAAAARSLRDAGGQDRAAIVQQFRGAAGGGGDAGRGRDLFRAICSACHRIGNDGGQLGPALDGTGLKPREELLVAILDPNRSVEENYRLWSLRTKDGRTLAGRVVAETRTMIRLLDLAGTEHAVPRDQLASAEPTPASLMPAGFEGLGVEGLRDLLAFLEAQR